MTKIMVYGSLRYREHNNHYLENSLRVGEGVTQDSFVLSGWGSVPFAYPLDENNNHLPHGRLHGEVWDADDYDLNRVRRLELGAGYEEKLVTVMVNNRETECLLYTNDYLADYNIIEPVAGVVSYPRVSG